MQSCPTLLHVERRWIHLAFGSQNIHTDVLLGISAWPGEPQNAGENFLCGLQQWESWEEKLKGEEHLHGKKMKQFVQQVD